MKTSKPVILKVWFLDQQKQPLGTCKKCRFSSFIPDQLDQKVWDREPAIQVITTPQAMLDLAH